ncbi:hypothetical protein FHU38_000894 [Saccharomonospora amisosensis]|uniref:HupE / UreJ protein n=1 Tax=Saccharomonospora amisosensis TaxID=1128677 RepID=A0A7X5UM45_9PSEU|nr:HupE/UreJ family protein [Saccharomonospora amisosensis]NIJ10550.1 hypothetical protein [Saccharomonospora amisosensis]
MISALVENAPVGIEHILGGFDHLLFVVVLLLGATTWRAVMILVTCFTVAHSATLAMAVFGWVHVPDAIIEPLIALSIVYAAAETALAREPRHQPYLVFGFGLVHGLGFATNLSLGGETGGALAGGLLGFNLGIEAGQLLIITVVFPLLLLIRRRDWSKHAQPVAAGMAATFGLFWFVERLLSSVGGAA